MPMYDTIQKPRRSPRLEASRGAQTADDDEERTKGTDDESGRDVQRKRRHVAQGQLRSSRTRIVKVELQPRSLAQNIKTAGLTRSIYRLIRSTTGLALLLCAFYCFSFLLLSWMCWIPLLRNNMDDLNCRICDVGTPWSHYLCESCDTWAKAFCKPCHTALRNYLPNLCGTSLVPTPTSDSANHTEFTPISVNNQKITNSTQMLSKLVGISHALLNTSIALTDAKVLSLKALNDAYLLHDEYLDIENLQIQLVQFQEETNSNGIALSNFINKFSLFIRLIRYDTADLLQLLKHWEQVGVKLSETCGTFLGRIVCRMGLLGHWMRSILGLPTPPPFISDDDKLMAYHIGNTTVRLNLLASIASSLVASFDLSQGYLHASFSLIDDAEQKMQNKDNKARGFWPLTTSLPQGYAQIRAPLSNAAAQIKLASDRTDQVNVDLQAIVDMLVESRNPLLNSAKETRTPLEIIEESLALLVEASTSWQTAKTPVYTT